MRLQSQPHDQPLRFNNSMDCIKFTLKNEGIWGFYKGIASPIVGAAAENACLFFSYNLAQDVLKREFGVKDLQLKHLVLCGGFSGFTASFILTPIELIKCKLQVENLYSQHRSSIMSLVRQVIAQDGIKGFWHGQTGTLLRECGGSASWFGTYEFVSNEFKVMRGASKESQNQTWELLASGASAGVLYNLSLFPADTVKSKMQTNSVVNSSSSTGSRSSSSATPTFVSTARQIYKNGGIKAFYRGLGITLIRAVPSNSVIFFTYESLKNNF